MKIPKLYAQNATANSIDLTLSVNPLGCSPRALQALRTLNMRDLNAYPDSTVLIQKIAKKCKVKPENVLLGNGSEQLIKLIAQTFIQPNDTVCIEKGSFGLFSKESLLAKGNVQLKDLKNITNSKPRVIFIANPKTPTGELIPQTTIKSIQKSASGIFVLDEANGEFINETAIPLAIKSKNMVVLRTFSKAFGLAGLRIGCVIGPTPLINKLATAQQPFPVSQVAIKLALVALSDDKFIAKTISFIANERKFLQQKLEKRGLTVSRSVTNNLFIEFANARELINELNRLGVSVINGTFFPRMTRSGFRISIKTRKINRLFLQKLDVALACLESKNLLRSKEDI